MNCANTMDYKLVKILYDRNAKRILDDRLENVFGPSFAIFNYPMTMGYNCQLQFGNPLADFDCTFTKVEFCWRRNPIIRITIESHTYGDHDTNTIETLDEQMIYPIIDELYAKLVMDAQAKVSLFKDELCSVVYHPDNVKRLLPNCRW